MKLTFLGVGAAMAPSSMWQSNMVLEKNGRRLLIDAGGDVRHSLREAFPSIHAGNVGVEIDAIYISHLHADHIGGLEGLALSAHFVPPHRKPLLYCDADLMDELWETSLKGGLETIEGKVADLTDFFDCKPIKANGDFEWEGVKCEPVQTLHVMSGRKFQHSYGLLMSDYNGEGAKTFLTTDTQFCPRQLPEFYAQAELIFHDCETSRFPSNVHAHFDDLKTLDAKYKAKMWLYHYNSPTPEQDAVANGFRGFVVKGQSFEL
jgi:ribonuclease BN (tRNA processing enzyme)